MQNKKENFIVVRHDGRLIINDTTDEILVDNRTKNDLQEDWDNDDIDVRRGLEDTRPIDEGSETAMWIRKHNEAMGEKFPNIKQALDSIQKSKEQGPT